MSSPSARGTVASAPPGVASAPQCHGSLQLSLRAPPRRSGGSVRAVCAVCPPSVRAAAVPSGACAAALGVPSGSGACPAPARGGGGGRALPSGGRRPRAAAASPQVRAARGGGGAAPDGGPGRAGPLRGRFLAGAGLRRAGAGGAAGRRVRRRVLLRPAHLRGRHRHLPQPRLVGVLVRGQPGGAARGAAGRRGAVGAQGPRGHAAAAAGARPQPPPHGRARPRPPRRAGAGALR